MIFEFKKHSFANLKDFSNERYVAYEDALNTLHSYCIENEMVGSKKETISIFNICITESYNIPTVYKKEGADRFIPIILPSSFSINASGFNEHLLIKSRDATDKQKLSIINFLIQSQWKMLKTPSNNHFSSCIQETYIEFNFDSFELSKIFEQKGINLNFDALMNSNKKCQETQQEQKIRKSELSHNHVDKPNVEKLSSENNQQHYKELLVEKSELKKEISQLRDKIAELEAQRMQYDQHKNEIDEVEIHLLNSDLLLISVLLRMLRDEIKIKGNKSQAKILQRIENENQSIKGLSKSRTEKIMAKANSLYKSLKKNEMK